jgi:hypothetical protein
VVWLRVDLETMKAIPDSLTARIHEQTSRQLEVKFDLEAGKSILVANRDFERPERLAQKHERFRGAQSGIDPRAISAELKALRQRCDSGQSFRAGMEAAGYVLARGDQRDYVIVDQAGHDHGLSRRLGMKAAELRAFMVGVNRSSLPNVSEAKSLQQARQSGHEARRRHEGREQQPSENSRPGGPEKGREDQAKPDRPLGPTQGAMRTAWALSHTGEQLTEALAARGIGLAQVTAAEAAANHRARAFAKEIGGRFVQPLREGEIVAINERGYVYRFEPRTVGVDCGEIAKRLAGIEAGSLLSVSDTKQIMREVRRAEWTEQQADKRDRARPLSGIEQRIIKCQQQAERGFWIDRGRGDERVSGAEALATALDQAGIAVVRVTAGDVKAINALQRDETLARLAADSNRESRRSQHFAGLEEGEIAAVDRFGNVHRLSPHKLDLEHLATELLVAAPLEDPTVTRLDSVTEARSQFEIDRETRAAVREAMMQQRMERATEASADPREPADRGLPEPGGIAAAAADIAAKALGAMLDFAASFIAPPPPPTREQLRERGEAVKDVRGRQAARQDTNERLAATVDMSRATRAHADREAEEKRERQRRREQEEEYGRDR